MSSRPAPAAPPPAWPPSPNRDARERRWRFCSRPTAPPQCRTSREPVPSWSPRSRAWSAARGRRWGGGVEGSGGVCDGANRRAKVGCTIANADRTLRPEMYATVSIATDTHQKLAVPRTSVVRVGDQMVAFVDKGPSPGGGERFERRIVGIDDSEAGELVPVTRGLRRGEKVVSSGAIILSGSGA